MDLKSFWIDMFFRLMLILTLILILILMLILTAIVLFILIFISVKRKCMIHDLRLKSFNQFLIRVCLMFEWNQQHPRTMKRIFDREGLWRTGNYCIFWPFDVLTLSTGTANRNLKGVEKLRQSPKAGTNQTECRNHKAKKIRKSTRLVISFWHLKMPLKHPNVSTMQWRQNGTKGEYPGGYCRHFNPNHKIQLSGLCVSKDHRIARGRVERTRENIKMATSHTILCKGTTKHPSICPSIRPLMLSTQK